MSRRLRQLHKLNARCTTCGTHVRHWWDEREVPGPQWWAPYCPTCGSTEWQEVMCAACGSAMGNNHQCNSY